MSRLRKIFTVCGIATLILLPIQNTEAYWGGGMTPWYSNPWRYSYTYDPAYRWGDPVTRKFIRESALYGPAYAKWQQDRRLWHGWGNNHPWRDYIW